MNKGKLILTVEGYNTKFSTEVSNEASAPVVMKLFVDLMAAYGYSRKSFIDLIGSDPADWPIVYEELEHLGL